MVISGFMIAAALKAPNENSTVIVLGCKVNGKKSKSNAFKEA